jgi:hypothetical protein
MHTKRCPDEVAVARGWGKRRPQITAFSYKLCHFERLALDKMVAAAGSASMCLEFDGLVVYSEKDSADLEEIVRRVQASTSRVLKVKPYAKTWEEWIAKVVLKYPMENWSAKSKFPWKDVKLAERCIQSWLNPDDPSLDGDEVKSKLAPDTDLAMVVSSVLECRVMIRGSNAYIFTGSIYEILNITNGLHHHVKEVLQNRYRTTPEIFKMVCGKWEVRLGEGGARDLFKVRNMCVKITLEVASDLTWTGSHFPEFDTNRDILAGNNGFCLNCRTMKIQKVHWGMYISKNILWPIVAWQNEHRFEYKAVVKQIVQHWKTAERPDLNVVYKEVGDDDEPVVLYEGCPALAAAYGAICQKIEYLRVRRTIASRCVDTTIYKEMWMARTVASLDQFCELLYQYGPAGSGKDVDALFIQELMGASMCFTLPTGDVVIMPGSSERGVEGSTPSMAATQKMRVAMVAEVPPHPIAWHRLKHFVEHQGVKCNTRVNAGTPTNERPTFAVLLLGNYAPDMGKVEGAARRTAVIRMDARFSARSSEDDRQYLDDANIKARIIAGDFVQDMLWTCVEWLSALRTMNGKIPRPNAVLLECNIAVPNPLKEWAERTLMPCVASNEATTCTVIKGLASMQTACHGKNDPQLAVAMRSAGFTLDVPTSGNKRRACKFQFAGAPLPEYVKVRTL